MNGTLKKALSLRDSKVLGSIWHNGKHYVESVDGSKCRFPFSECTVTCVTHLGLIFARMGYYELDEDNGILNFSLEDSFVVTENLILPIKVTEKLLQGKSRLEYLAGIVSEFRGVITHFVYEGKLFELNSRKFHVSFSGSITTSDSHTLGDLTLLEAYDGVIESMLNSSNKF